MRKLLPAVLFLFHTFLIAGSGQSGEIIRQKDFSLPDDWKGKILESPGLNKYKPQYTYLNGMVIKQITYLSDGNRVEGFLLYPETRKKIPCIIYNRGGNREFGAINTYKLVHILARISSWGYVVVASQYRGNAGGEGREEFGGRDVNDILNLIPLLDELPQADSSRLGMFGWSRGGMMTYLVLTRTRRVVAAVVGAGLSDLFEMKKSRPVMEQVYAELIPDYDHRKRAALSERSAVRWPDKLCKTTPLLLLHGSADWRVVPRMALDLARGLLACRHPFRLVLLEGGDHALSEHSDEVYRMSRQWLDRYVRDQSPLPKLEPHGK